MGLNGSRIAQGARRASYRPIALSMAAAALKRIIHAAAKRQMKTIIADIDSAIPGIPGGSFSGIPGVVVLFIVLKSCAHSRLTVERSHLES